MRVLVLTNLYPNPYQPHRAPFNRQQFAAMAARHELAIIAPIAWTDELRLRRKSDGRMPIDRQLTIEGIRVDHPRYLFPPKMFRGWYGECFRRSARAQFRVALDEFRPDIVLASWAYPDGWAAVELAREAGLPVAVKVHGSDVLLLRRSSARYRRTVEALQRADSVIAVSRQLAGEVMALGIDPVKVRVVYNGIDRSLFFPADGDAARERLGIGGDEPLILSVGNLAAVKGPDILIEACDHLAQRGVHFQCRMIGQGAMKASLERTIRQRGLGEKIKLLGSRPLAELPDWYRAAAMLVLPSRSEGLPNVVLEAMACGTRVVASRVGGVSEIAGDGVLLVAPGDPEALAAAIEQTLSQPSRARSYSTEWPTPSGVGARFNPACGLAGQCDSNGMDPLSRKRQDNRAPNAKAMGHPTITTDFTPPSWDQSAEALARVLDGLLVSKRRWTARAA